MTLAAGADDHVTEGAATSRQLTNPVHARTYVLCIRTAAAAAASSSL